MFLHVPQCVFVVDKFVCDNLELMEAPLWQLLTTDLIKHNNKVKVRSYTALNPILQTDQNTLYFTSLAELFNQTPQQLLWQASNQAAINEIICIQISTSVYNQVLVHTDEWIIWMSTPVPKRNFRCA